MQKTETTLVHLNELEQNPLNDRSMDADQIDVIAESISTYGLLQPIVVYETEDGIYRILAGHKRFKALSSILNDDDTVSVIVRDKPENEYIEKELIASANIHRNKPEDLKKEAKIFADQWYHMDSTRKKELSARYEKQFRKENADNPAYEEDSDLFMRLNFRPRLQYIKAMTGLDVHNSTVKRWLYDSLPEGEEIDEKAPKQEEETKTEKKETVVNEKKIIKECEKLIGYLEMYNAYDAGLIGLIEDTVTCLDDLKSSIADIV